MMKDFILSILVLIPFSIRAQSVADTIPSKTLNNIIIKSYRVADIPTQLNDVHDAYLIGGRKTEVLPVSELSVNIAEKTGRQIFAKIPGAFIYDMDGSGNQVNIATRGLDPHRSWEFNVRQNGIMINTDIYGYPASHYSPPMEAIKNIEIIRGTASLQYGAEFGGMINYVTKTPDTTKSISFENLTSAGSFGLFSTFNSLGGKVGKLTYYTYYHHRVSDGYRDNSRSDAQAQFASLKYDFSDKLSLRAEFGRSQYRYQIPGPLTDSMFYANPRQSTRSRNYYSPDIYVPSLTLNWNINTNTMLQWVVSGVYGNRSSVEFEGFADKADVIDPVTLQYKPRAVNIDKYKSRTSEARIIHHYQIGNLKSVVSAGLMYMNNNMHRLQQGKGTTGSDYNLSITGDWGRDLFYKSRNIAFSIENMIYVTPSLTVSPGFRYDRGKTDMIGYISYLDPADIPNRIDHNIPAFGINAQYRFKTNARIYGGISQAYRPVLFKDIIPGSTLERANKDLKDAFGYNAEIGVNGRMGDWMKYDVTIFRVLYQNRLGNLLLTDNNVNYIYKTNIGDSHTNGVEFYAEVMPVRSRTTYISVFTSTSYMKAIYENATLAVGSENRDISGNEVESVPRWISRNGLNINYKSLRTTLQYSYVDKSFAEPTNQEKPTPNGAKGIVPAYGIWDINMSFRFATRFVLKASINNVADKQYFTKRPLFYPGPGVWSSDGRSFVISLGVKI
ncbi:MAG: TonB-dependent receptor [Saprospiraceae bacterium]